MIVIIDAIDIVKDPTTSYNDAVSNIKTMASSDSKEADSQATTSAALASIYGQKPQPDETPEFLSKSHAELNAELDKLDDDKRAGWLRAKEECPTLVGEEHRLIFLRCEVFNAEVRTPKSRTKSSDFVCDCIAHMI